MFPINRWISELNVVFRSHRVLLGRPRSFGDDEGKGMTEVGDNVRNIFDSDGYLARNEWLR